MANENRVVYAIPSVAFENGNVDDQGQPIQGIYRVLFEEIQSGKERRNYAVNQEEYLDDPAEIFIANGYSKIERSSSQPMVKISIKKNENESSEPNHKNYIGYYQNAKPLSQEQVCSFFKLPLPSAHHPMVVLPYKPVTRYIYIVDEGTAYGPFITEKIEGTGIDTTYEINPPSPNDFKNNKGLVGSVFKFDYQEAVDNNYITESNEYSVSFNTSMMLSQVPKDVHEFLTPLVINGIIGMAIREQSGTKKRQSNITYAVKAIDSLKSASFSLSIKQNLKNHLNNLLSTNWDKDLLNSLYTIVTENENGEEILRAVYQDKKNELELSWRGELDEKSSSIKDEIKQLEGDRTSLQSELENIKRELLKESERLKQTESQVVGFNGEVLSEEDAARLKEELSSITSELEIKRGELDDLQTQYCQYKKLSDIEKTVQEQVILEKHYDSKIANLKDTLKATTELLNKEEKDLQKKLREYAPFVSTLIQAPLPVEDIKYKIDLESEVYEAGEISSSELQELTVDLLVAIQARLSNQHNRMITLSALSSIMVAQYQSFLSIFSGPPGVGKTSFYRILQSIMKQGEFSLEIPVGKGWISERELIGFFNSLTEKFAAAPSGIYQYLKAIESINTNKIPSTTILLDEANLSPIEQYWSPFLVMADADSDRVLRLTNESIKIPQTLRFVGTTNHDMTTEPLSARLIDRAPIIPMDMIFNDDVVNPMLADLKVETYSADTLEKMFGNNSVFSSEILSESLHLLDRIYDILQSKDPELGQRFIISQRKKQNIDNYISTLAPLLSRTVSSDRSISEKEAIDYAVVYFLLPMISGTGEQLGKRLDNLLSLCDQRQLQMSSDKLKDMISRSKYTLDTFSFFQY